MKAGIIAAGRGERFRSAGVTTPKPLIEVAGRPLLARAVDSAVAAGVSEVAILVNAESPEVAAFVRRERWLLPVSLTVETTPSSMESVFVLAPSLGEAPFLLLTVDALVPAAALRGLVRAGLANGPVGTLGLTGTVDDEKPLHVELGDEDRIRRLGPDAKASPWVTNGVYVFHPTILARMEEARRRRLAAFRELLAFLVTSGDSLFGFPMGPCVDVDRPSDLAAAEQFVLEERQRE